jgi:hypothetical protein
MITCPSRLLPPSRRTKSKQLPVADPMSKLRIFTGDGPGRAPSWGRHVLRSCALTPPAPAYRPARSLAPDD